MFNLKARQKYQSDFIPLTKHISFAAGCACGKCYKVNNDGINETLGKISTDLRLRFGTALDDTIDYLKETIPGVSDCIFSTSFNLSGIDSAEDGSKFMSNAGYSDVLNCIDINVEILQGQLHPIISSLCHEAIHCNQFFTERLTNPDNGEDGSDDDGKYTFFWKDKPHLCNMKYETREEYMQRPWEVEAFINTPDLYLSCCEKIGINVNPENFFRLCGEAKEVLHANHTDSLEVLSILEQAEKGLKRPGGTFGKEVQLAI